MADTLFNEADQTLVDPEKDYFSDLVGEGKKYKEPRDAGRALVEKDLHIAKIEKENSALREETTKRKTVQELVDQITAARTKAAPPVNNQETEEQDPPNKPIPQPKVEDLVRDALAAQQQATSQSTNRKKVAEVLRAQFGTGYVAVLTEKVEQLGLGQQFVDDLAGRSPLAVFQLLGITETPRTTQTPVAAVRANPGAVTGGRKNFEHYDKIRKTNPGLYHSSRMTQEMIAAATEQGDDFYR